MQRGDALIGRTERGYGVGHDMLERDFASAVWLVQQAVRVAQAELQRLRSVGAVL
jgi:hypothetical protein